MLDLQDFGYCVDLLVLDFGSPDLHGGGTIDVLIFGGNREEVGVKMHL